MESKIKYYFNMVADRSAFLSNGDRVKEGDAVKFTNSDGEICMDIIRRRDDGTLYFWNTGFKIIDYINAEKVKDHGK